MKAEELMIGDWVLFHDSGYNSDGSMWYKDRVCQVVGIGCSPRLLWIDEDGDKEEWPHGSYSDLDPIPLTIEILKKNGFRLVDDDYYCNDGDTIILTKNHGNWPGEHKFDWVKRVFNASRRGQFINLDSYIATIDYVYQLQNALRLCGINKEIVL